MLVTAVKDMVQSLVAKCVLLFCGAGMLIESHTNLAASILRSPVQLHNPDNMLSYCIL